MRSNAKYLTLALDIRKLSDSLLKIAEDDAGDSPELNQAIQRFILSLTSTDQKGSVKALRERGEFGHVENVVTVNEVISPPQRSELVAKLRAVLEPARPEQRREGALVAIGFFDSIERRALYHYNHPKSSSRSYVGA